MSERVVEGGVEREGWGRRERERERGRERVCLHERESFESFI